MEKAKASQDTDTAPSRSHSWSVFILAASAVLREGIESVIFLAGKIRRGRRARGRRGRAGRRCRLGEMALCCCIAGRVECGSKLQMQ